MSEWKIKTKFDIGDKVYTIQKEKVKISCHICKGLKKIKYNNMDMKCPECAGKGVFISDDTISMVRENPFTVSMIKVSIDNRNGVEIKYKCGDEYGNRTNRKESNLYKTVKQAQKACDELNTEKKFINVGDIIISDKFAATNPSREKLQRKLLYYVESNKFDKPIVIDKDNTLVDGYINYLICGLMGIKSVIAVVENQTNVIKQ